MGGVAFIVILLAFIGNRIFGLYKDETTTRILEESGALRSKRKPTQPQRYGQGQSVRKYRTGYPKRGGVSPMELIRTKRRLRELGLGDMAKYL